MATQSSFDKIACSFSVLYSSELILFSLCLCIHALVFPCTGWTCSVLFMTHTCEVCFTKLSTENKSFYLLSLLFLLYLLGPSAELFHSHYFLSQHSMILWFCDLTFLLQSFSPPLSVVLLQQLSAAPFCAFPVFYSFLVKSVAPVRGKGTEPCWGCVLRKASDFVIFRRASCEQQEVFFPIGKPVFLMNLVDGFLKFYLCKSHFLLEK